MSKKLVVAIDGPAGSGKSTSAKRVAERLGFLYIDTGAMYRAVTLLALENNVLSNPEEISKLTSTADIKLDFSGGKTEVFLNGTNVTTGIRSKEVNENVSEVSKIKFVREALVRMQRDMVKDSSIVMEGRDIGTVVFPDADVKIFLTASLEKRTERRLKEYQTGGSFFEIEDIKKNLQQRDKIDSTREESPLVKADDAVEIDTSASTFEEQVNKIINIVKETAVKKGIELKVKP
jgi:CMP/dCMP kinase